eukprot:3109907-Ditylum_brightwellii.AAC.1
MDMNTINIIFPVNNKYGTLDLPAHFLHNAKAVREWRWFGKQQQQQQQQHHQVKATNITMPGLDETSTLLGRLVMVWEQQPAMTFPCHWIH